MSDYTVILNRPVYITDSTGSVLSVALSSLTASYALTASYVAGADTTWDSVQNKPDGLVSSSIQVNSGSFTGSFVGDGSGLTGIVASGVGIEVADDGVTRGVAERLSFDANITASVANGTASIAVSLPQGVVSASSQATAWTVATASYALNAVTELPAGLVSSSAQVDYTQIQNQPTSIPTASFVGNALVTASVAATTITFEKGDGSTFNVEIAQSGSVESASYASTAGTSVSSSFATTASYALNTPTLPNGLVSSSAQIDYNVIQNQPTTIPTASHYGNAVVTASAVATTITFTKANGTTFDVTVSQSGSVESASYASVAQTVLNAPATASYAVTASAATSITFTPTSASYAETASYALNSVSELPSGLVSSSVQITLQETTGQLSASRLDGSVPSASYAETAVSSSYFTGSIDFPDGLTVTGSTLSTGGFTGSLQGTSSFAVTASYALNAVGGESASFATTASYAQTAGTASYFSGSALFENGLVVTGSLEVTGGITGSFGGSIESASYALTASYALNGGGSVPEGTVSSSTQIVLIDTTGNLSGSRIVGLVPSASTAVTASYIEGNIEFPNGLDVTGSVVSTGGFTGSLVGTASAAVSSSYALTASYALNGGGGGESASFATTASYATTSSHAQSVSGFVSFPDGLDVTGSLVVTGGITGSISGSIASAISSSYAATSSLATQLPRISFTTAPVAITAAYQTITSGTQHLENGTYAVSCTANTQELNNYRLSGILSWTSTAATITVQDEVPVHRSGYTTASLFLRTNAVSGSEPQLQLGSDTPISSSTYSFTFTRLA